MKTPPAIVRAAEPGDQNLIWSSWSRSYCESIDHPRLAGFIRRSIFEEAHKGMIKELTAKARVLVACSPDRNDQVFGWICFDLPATLHYVFTKLVFKRHGIARLLLAASGIAVDQLTCTHMTTRGGQFLTGVGARIDYEPRIARLTIEGRPHAV